MVYPIFIPPNAFVATVVESYENHQSNDKIHLYDILIMRPSKLYYYQICGI